MQKNEKSRDPVPSEFGSYEQAAEFWDTHDLTDYDDVWKEVEVQVRLDPARLSIHLEPQVAEQVVAQAKQQRVSPDIFVNRILQEYLKKQAA